jgi:hypothetical protein
MGRAFRRACDALCKSNCAFSALLKLCGKRRSRRLQWLRRASCAIDGEGAIAEVIEPFAQRFHGAGADEIWLADELAESGR